MCKSGVDFTKMWISLKHEHMPRRCHSTSCCGCFHHTCSFIHLSVSHYRCMFASCLANSHTSAFPGPQVPALVISLVRWQKHIQFPPPPSCFFFAFSYLPCLPLCPLLLLLMLLLLMLLLLLMMLPMMLMLLMLLLLLMMLPMMLLLLMLLLLLPWLLLLLVLVQNVDCSVFLLCRVLIFSQMVRVLDIISDYMRLRGFQHQRLDGSTPSAARHQVPLPSPPPTTVSPTPSVLCVLAGHAGHQGCSPF